MIKTGSWFGALPEGHIRIGISRGTPRFQKAGYRMFPRLAPGPWFNSVDTETYKRLYAEEILNRLDPHAVADQLHELAGGLVPVLCCYERVGKGWCHRSLAASWLAQGLGVPVPELGHEDRAQADHPMRPPGLVPAG